MERIPACWQKTEQIAYLNMPENFWRISQQKRNGSMAGHSKSLFAQTLRAARAFVLQVGKSNSFDMCSGWSKVYAV